MLKFEADKVNPGDKVAVSLDYGKSFRIVTVVKKTPTGLIKLSDGDTYTADGNKRGNASRFHFPKLYNITDELLAIKADNEHLSTLRHFDKWNTLTPDQRARIVAILKEKPNHE